MGSDRNGQLDRIERFANLIQRQTGRVVRPYRSDGYVNLINRYGTQKDINENYFFSAEPQFPDELLAQYYEGNGLFAKIIDTPAEEAVSHGFTLDGLADEKLESFYTEALEDLDWETVATTAGKWARLFGGALAVMLIDDGRGLEEPLDWKNIRSIDGIRVYERAVVQPDYQSAFSYEPDDPFRTRGSRLGMPEYYHVYSQYGNFVVHDSRCLVFCNGVLPEFSSNSVYQLWGTPEYVRIHRAIRDAEIAHGSASKLLDRSVQPIYKMQNLAAELATEEGENRVLKRLQTIDMARGMMNSITIDAEGEDYDFRSFSYTGVADVIDSSCNFLSAITSIPQTILFGRAPAGMNATGESDMENYYNFILKIQKRTLKKNLQYLLSIIFYAGVLDGEIDEVPTIKVKFNPLWSMSDLEQAQLEQAQAGAALTRAQVATAYIQAQVIDPSEVRKKLAESDEFNIETMLDDLSEEELMEHMPGQGGGQQGDPMAAMMGGGDPAAMMGGGDPAAMMGGGNPMATAGGGGAPQMPDAGAKGQAQETPETKKPEAADKNQKAEEKKPDAQEIEAAKPAAKEETPQKSSAEPEEKETEPKAALKEAPKAKEAEQKPAEPEADVSKGVSAKEKEPKPMSEKAKVKEPDEKAAEIKSTVKEPTKAKKSEPKPSDVKPAAKVSENKKAEVSEPKPAPEKTKEPDESDEEGKKDSSEPDDDRVYEYDAVVREDDDGKWVTINGTHILLDKDNVAVNGPLKGKKFTQARSKKSESETKPKLSGPKTKKEFITKMHAAIQSSSSDDKKSIIEVLKSAGSGTRVRMPDSWNDDDGKPTIYEKNDEGKWIDKNFDFATPAEELADYFAEGKVDPNEMPSVTKFTVNEGYVPSDAVLLKQSGEGDPEKFGNVSDDALQTAINDIMTDGMYSAADRAHANRYDGQAQFFAGYMSGVTQGEESQEAFNSYNYHGDRLINSMCRGSEPRTQEQSDEWQENQEQTRKYINQMTEACARRPLREEGVVFRGLETYSAVMKALGIRVEEGVDVEKLFADKDFVESLNGRTFSDLGFTSTSIDESVPKKMGVDKACSMEIMLPKGTQGTYFGDNLRITDEYEYLLQRGSQFMVMNAYTTNDAFTNKPKLHLRVALIGQEPQDIPELKKYQG